MPWLRHVFADGGYAGDKLREVLARRGDWVIEIIKRSDAAKGFVLLQRRWVVERTFARLGRNRRLAKDFEDHRELNRMALHGFRSAYDPKDRKSLIKPEIVMSRTLSAVSVMHLEAAPQLA